MNNLCKYRNIFGQAREGVHSYRYMDVAIIDVVLTIVCAVCVSRYYGYCLWKTIFVFFILGTLMHRLFCVNTKVNTMIFGRV